MQYLLLIYDNEADFGKMSEAELAAMYAGLRTLYPEHPAIGESSRRAPVAARGNRQHGAHARWQTVR